MDDDITKIAPSEGEKGKQAQPNESGDWKSIAGDKFKSEAELAKAYKELETKFGQQSNDIREGREFAETVAPVLKIIKDDPEAFKLIDEKLRAANTPETGKNKTAKQEKKDDELRQVASDILIKDFEAKHGFNDLSSDEAKTLRQKMGSLVLDMTGQSISDVDLRRLGTALDHAYVLATQSDKRTDQDGETDTESGAKIGSIPSSKGKNDMKLSPDEVKVASKLGLTAEQYLSGKK